MAGQRNDLAEKKRVFVDTVEWTGLIRVNELNLKKGTIEVPGDGKVRKIQNGVNQIPDLELSFKLTRSTPFPPGRLKDLRNWYKRDETHTVTIQRTDAAGTVFAKTEFVDCECVDYFEPEYDALNPTFAQGRVVLVASDVTFPKL